MSQWLETDFIRLRKGLTIEIRYVELISFRVEYRSFRLVVLFHKFLFRPASIQHR